MARVFVTGGSGFIGGALIARLLERGDDVVALARSDRAAETVAGRGAQAARGDVLDEGRLAAGMEGCEIAYHVAAINTHCPPDPELLLRTNVQGAENAVRAAARAGIRRVVFTSSAASVGEPKGTIGREDTEHRGSYLSIYDKSKHHGEQAAFGEGARLGVDVVAVNPSSVQGPGRASGNGKLIIDYVNGKLPVFVDTHVSIADIRDVVEAHVLAAERGAGGERYVINGATIHTDDVVEIVREVAGLSHRVRMVPPAVARAAALAAEGAARVRGKKTSSFCPARVRTILHGHQYDGSRAERELGLSYTPVHETFSRTLEWAASEGLLDT